MYRKMYREYVQERLAQYGVTGHDLYTRYTQVNGMVRLRLLADGTQDAKGINTIMSRELYEASIRMADRVLPPLKEESK